MSNFRHIILDTMSETYYRIIEQNFCAIAYHGVTPENGDVLAMRHQSRNLTIRECECLCFNLRNAEFPKGVRGILTSMWRRVGESYIRNGVLPNEYSTVEQLIRAKPQHC